jgi:hypothetical protein
MQYFSYFPLLFNVLSRYKCFNRLPGAGCFIPEALIIKHMSDKDVGSKNGGALKWLAAGAIILFFIFGGLGLIGISAFLFMKQPGSEKKTDDNLGPPCGPQEIRSGASCCLDRNGNGICDLREDATTRPVVSQTQYDPPTTSTRVENPSQTTTSSSVVRSTSTTSSLPLLASTSTTSTTSATTAQVSSATTTTSLSRNLVSSCANKYDVSSDTIIYVYTPKCCEKTVSPIVEQASKAGGYRYKYVAADALDKSAEGLLKCYLPPGYISVPQLICPANGNTRILTSQGTFDQIISFSKKCLEAAYM